MESSESQILGYLKTNRVVFLENKGKFEYGILSYYRILINKWKKITAISQVAGGVIGNIYYVIRYLYYL